MDRLSTTILLLPLLLGASFAKREKDKDNDIHSAFSDFNLFHPDHDAGPDHDDGSDRHAGFGFFGGFPGDFGHAGAASGGYKQPYYVADGLGSWQVFVENAGVSAMQMAINHRNKAVYFDSTIYQPSQLALPQPCRPIIGALHGEVDCWAHAAEVDLKTGAVRPLRIITDTWCSSGGLGPDGTLVQTGGWKDGGRAVRYLKDCDTCDFEEYPMDLSGERWYSTQVQLADGSYIVIGGRQMFSYEYVPPPGRGNTANIELPFLAQTTDKVENNLYPFAHLNTDGNIFLFANDRAILFEPQTGKVVRTYPPLKGGGRNYPASGMSALLPIDLSVEAPDVEVLVCGGAVKEAFDLAAKGQFPDALTSCGRISVNNPGEDWHVEHMPVPRTTGDMVLLPNGEVLILNGASKGCSGWDYQRDPTLHPLLYRPYMDPATDRFTTLMATTIPRVYHSVAALLQDGSILVAGSNTNGKYLLKDVMFPTEMRIEKFYPPYFHAEGAAPRPTIVKGTVPEVAEYGQNFKMRIKMKREDAALVEKEDLMVTMYSPTFTTHGFSMNQRLLMLKIEEVDANGRGTKVAVTATMPTSGYFAPPGYYMLFAVYKGIPSEAVWVRLH